MTTTTFTGSKAGNYRSKTEKPSVAGRGRIITRNHASRANKLTDAALRGIAKDCYPEYVSPFSKIADC